jgi:protein disulfide-isomerase A6
LIFHAYASSTADGESLCEKFEVRGYPTIKYFVDGDNEGQAYQGGRDFDSLKQHVEDHLEVKCQVDDPSECSDKEKAYIEKMKAKSVEERTKQIERLEKMKDDPHSMNAELKQWLKQRLRILKGLEKTKDEL